MSDTVKPQHPKLVLIDMESSGLDATKDLLFEISAVAIEPMTLKVLGRFNQVVGGKPERGLAQSLLDTYHNSNIPNDDFVVKTHGANGLLDDVVALGGTMTALKVDSAASTWLERMLAGSADVKPLWVGNSPLLDRQLIGKRLPHFYSMMSHRSLDLSSFREAHKMWETNGSIAAVMPKDETDHRATTCAENSYRQLEFFKNFLWPQSRQIVAPHTLARVTPMSE